MPIKAFSFPSLSSVSRPLEDPPDGASVKDAVRISRERVTEWWVRECEERARSGTRGEIVGGGYRIVTGVGRHSEGGRGKLGPAVGAMLVREGWKIEVGGGVIVVRGVAKR